ncbi:hypothetical protein Tco_0847277 [Tanacetum coccineum]
MGVGAYRSWHRDGLEVGGRAWFGPRKDGQLRCSVRSRPVRLRPGLSVGPAICGDDVRAQTAGRGGRAGGGRVSWAQGPVEEELCRFGLVGFSGNCGWFGGGGVGLVVSVVGVWVLDGAVAASGLGGSGCGFVGCRGGVLWWCGVVYWFGGGSLGFGRGGWRLVLCGVGGAVLFVGTGVLGSCVLGVGVEGWGVGIVGTVAGCIVGRCGAVCGRAGFFGFWCRRGWCVGCISGVAVGVWVGGDGWLGAGCGVGRGGEVGAGRWSCRAGGGGGCGRLGDGGWLWSALGNGGSGVCGGWVGVWVGGGGMVLAVVVFVCGECGWFWEGFEGCGVVMVLCKGGLVVVGSGVLGLRGGWRRGTVAECGGAWRVAWGVWWGGSGGVLIVVRGVDIVWGRGVVGYSWLGWGGCGVEFVMIGSDVRFGSFGCTLGVGAEWGLVVPLVVGLALGVVGCGAGGDCCVVESLVVRV